MIVVGVLLPAVDVFGSLAEAAGTTPSSTTLTSNAVPNVYGQSVTFSATVSGAGAAPTGTVTFFNGTSAASTRSLGLGTGSWTTTLPVGAASITATYNGNSSTRPSTSPTISQVTDKTPTTMTLTPSASPASAGSPLTLTAFVAAAAPGNGAPSSGTVKFYDGARQIGSGTPSSGSVSVTVSNLSIGIHTLSAAFGGSASYNLSTSSNLALVVSPPATSTVLVAIPNPAALGGTVTFAATVSSGAGTPSGSVTFSDEPRRSGPRHSPRGAGRHLPVDPLDRSAQRHRRVQRERVLRGARAKR